MKKQVIIAIIFVVLVIPIFIVIIFLTNKNAELFEREEIIEEILETSIKNLGDLCDNQEECIAFCQNNLGECESYCNENKNELCLIIFHTQQEPQNRQTTTQENQEKTQDRPVLKNLGVNIESWNKQTNLAGDLIFSKKLLFDDGYISNDKVFIDFGHKERYRPDDKGSIEYWFFVPLGTKVRAPTGGKIQVVYFNHTKDWGINIMQENSNYIVSFEHVVNVAVKEGEIVIAGDIVGEAAPRNTFNNEIAMVELAVWNPGVEIIKYCPFNYLDVSLKSVYEERLKRLASDWEEFIGKDVYQQERWVAPGCLVESIVER